MQIEDTSADSLVMLDVNGSMFVQRMPIGVDALMEVLLVSTTIDVTVVVVACSPLL